MQLKLFMNFRELNHQRGLVGDNRHDDKDKEKEKFEGERRSLSEE
jgi:hypothetical protein